MSTLTLGLLVWVHANPNQAAGPFLTRDLLASQHRSITSYLAFPFPNNDEWCRKLLRLPCVICDINIVLLCMRSKLPRPSAFDRRWCRAGGLGRWNLDGDVLVAEARDRAGCLSAGAGRHCEFCVMPNQAAGPFPTPGLLLNLSYAFTSFPTSPFPRQDRPQNPTISSCRLHHWLASPQVPTYAGLSS
jgi:hypothetical protein